MRVKFAVITRAPEDPKAGIWADAVCVVKEGVMYVDCDPDLGKPLTEFVAVSNGESYEIKRVVVKAFEVGEIVMVDEDLREVCGHMRRLDKWDVDYELYDDVNEAIERAVELSARRNRLEDVEQ